MIKLNTVGVVLAGGQSKRMKIDKSTLRWKGKNMVEHTTKLLTEAGCKEVLISNNNNPRYIQDRYKGAGPLAGIEACLYFINEHFPEADAMLVMPVDMPLMQIALLKQLISEAKNNSVTHFNQGRFPLILPVNKYLSDLLSAALGTGSGGASLSIHRLLTHFNQQVIDIDKDHKNLFINCNTPEQWQQLTDSTNLK